MLERTLAGEDHRHLRGGFVDGPDDFVVAEGAAGLLLLTYRNALDLAAQQGIHSIAFPAISTGRFSYPKQAATRIAVQAVRDWKKQHPQAAMQVIFFCADMGIYNGFLCSLQAEERGIEK